MTINRCIVIILDSAGIGAMPDAPQFGDEGANTLKHIMEAMGENYYLPNMAKLGLYNLLSLHGKENIVGSFGKLSCASPAKDTTAGHWELSGLVLKKPFPTYPHGFPEDIISKFEELIGKKVIGNCTASGTEIIKTLGSEHVASGCPIVYTSADSVFQIAAHEETFGLKKLYEICRIARELLCGEHAVGRVIARPFTGSDGNFVRTPRRRDFSVAPFGTTILDLVKKNGGEVTGIGKIEDIFNGRGLTKTIHTENNAEGMRCTLEEVISSPKSTPSLILTNLVDFDMIWGHRRDVLSYAAGLFEFDAFLPSLLKALGEDDMLFITADHGCDPTYKKHTDHTREYVPLLVYGDKIKGGIDLGIRSTFADVGQSISDVFGLPPMENGASFIDNLIIK